MCTHLQFCIFVHFFTYYFLQDYNLYFEKFCMQEQKILNSRSMNAILFDELQNWVPLSKIEYNIIFFFTLQVLTKIRQQLLQVLHPRFHIIWQLLAVVTLRTKSKLRPPGLAQRTLLTAKVMTLASTP